jgi:hypothetical protein
VWIEAIHTPDRGRAERAIAIEEKHPLHMATMADPRQLARGMGMRGAAPAFTHGEMA